MIEHYLKCSNSARSSAMCMLTPVPYLLGKSHVIMGEACYICMQFYSYCFKTHFNQWPPCCCTPNLHIQVSYSCLHLMQQHTELGIFYGLQFLLILVQFVTAFSLTYCGQITLSDDFYASWVYLMLGECWYSTVVEGLEGLQRSAIGLWEKKKCQIHSKHIKVC